MKENTSTTMSTEPEIPVGTDNFDDLLLSGNIFVDKSMFIKEFLEASSGKVVLITRPRRWGKSLNMDMLKRFLSIEVDEQGAPIPQEESYEPQALCWRRGSDRTSGQARSSNLSSPQDQLSSVQHLVTEYQGQVSQSSASV